MADSRDYDAAIRAFKEKLQECTVTAVCGREYILVGKLKSWLRSEVSGNTTRASRLFKTVYRRRHPSQPGLPVCDFSRGNHSCLLVFCILLELGSGELVEKFKRTDIVDRRLPIDLPSLQEEIAAMRLPAALAERFDEMQRRFCAITFDLDMDRDYIKNQVLPICEKKTINDKGGTAQLWQIAVQEEFVGEKLRNAVALSEFDDSKDLFGKRYEFALKTFEEGNKKLYENEVQAFGGLRKHGGMVRYLGNYVHKEMRQPLNPQENRARDEAGTKTTYNILLEYGEADLDEHFQSRLPPILPKEIKKFWQALFEVADAVDGIHNLKIEEEGETREYHGWHADIKPDNILIVNEKFKLADPGFAKFIKKADGNPKEIVTGGTETYGAPECYSGMKGTRSAVTQTIDIWSLGCVFSIVATWVVLGYQGMRTFNILRENAIEKLIQEQHSSLGGSTTILDNGDYFHNGRQVLSEVKSWHNFLRSVLRKTDTITSQVLDLVDQAMLLENATERITAKDLCDKLRQISKSSLAKRFDVMPEFNASIMEALLEIDKHAPSKYMHSLPSEVAPEPSQFLTVVEDRKARKSKVLGLPMMKTTHRSEYLDSALAERKETKPSNLIHSTLIEESSSAEPPGSQDSHSGVSQPHEINDSMQPIDTLGHDEYRHLPSGRQSIISLPSRSQHRRSTRNGTSQNVFQAREEAKKLNTRNWRHLSKVKKDSRLERHFKNRDIKFLVDNAESMKEFWEEATYVLKTLAMKAKGQDENGMDLAFTSGLVKVDGKKNASAFKEAMKKDGARPMANIHTDMKKSLGDVLDAYHTELKRKRERPSKKETEVKDLTLIVLTDGVWAGMYNKEEVSELIVKFLKNLRVTIGDIRNPVSIEFIQFGDDEDATYRLRRLDNDLKRYDIPDVIDTEPSYGDVNKMLLGSFVEAYDEKDEDGLGSPPVLQSSYSGDHSFTTTPPPIVGPYSPPIRTPTNQSAHMSGTYPSPTRMQNTFSHQPPSGEQRPPPSVYSGHQIHGNR